MSNVRALPMVRTSCVSISQTSAVLAFASAHQKNRHLLSACYGEINFFEDFGAVEFAEEFVCDFVFEFFLLEFGVFHFVWSPISN